MSAPTRNQIQLAMRRLFALLTGHPLTSIVLARPTSDSPKLAETFVVVDVLAYAVHVGIDERLDSWDDATSTLTETVSGQRNTTISFSAYGPAANDLLETFGAGIASSTAQDFLSAPIVTTVPAVSIDRLGIQYGGSITNTSRVVGTSFQISATRDIVVSHGSEYTSVVTHASKLVADVTTKDENQPDLTSNIVVNE